MTASPFSTPEPETRRLCPVCPGLPMRKVVLGAGPRLTTLDGCGRCGGVWFDAGEVDRLRRLGMQALEAHVTLAPDAYRKRCGACDASYGRNDDRCPACKAPNELRCPTCMGLLQTIRTPAAKLDACRRCRGVWFDSVELTEIWNTALTVRRPNGVSRYQLAANSFDTLWFASMLVPDGTSLGSGAEQAAGGAAAAGLDAGAGVVEATTGLASSVFEAIAELIGGIFG